MFHDLRLQENHSYYIKWLFGFSIATNVLLLALPLHILQVYSRVLNSGSISTLLFLTFIVMIMLAVSAFADYSRRRIARRLANRYLIDGHQNLVRSMVQADDDTLSTSKTISKLRTVVAFLSSRLFIGLFDLPFTLFFLVALFLLNVWLGVVAAIGLAAMVCLALLSNRAVSTVQTVSEDREADAFNFASATLRGTDEVRAMGMTEPLQGRWRKRLLSNFEAADDVSQVASGYAVAGTLLKQFLQVVIISVGALLVLSGSMSGGVIFAAILITNRMLSPVGLTIGGWNSIMRSYRAHLSLSELIANGNSSADAQFTQPLKGKISAGGIHHSLMKQRSVVRVLDDVSLTINPGTITVVTGKPGSGKTLLARIMTGALDPEAGVLKMDGLPRQHWPDQEWGRAIGYVAQDIKLFPVSVAENISRLVKDDRSDHLVRAAKIANAHGMIQSLPNGYATVLERGKIRLSDRQKVKLALARACYGNPRFLILDEPDTELDRDDQKELINSLEKLKQTGTAILVMSRRSRMKAVADRVLEIKSGDLRVVDEYRDNKSSVTGGAAVSNPHVDKEPAAAALVSAPVADNDENASERSQSTIDLLAKIERMFEKTATHGVK